MLRYLCVLFLICSQLAVAAPSYYGNDAVFGGYLYPKATGQLLGATGQRWSVWVDSINSSVSATELGYLDGVTSALQTQLNALVSADSALDTRLDTAEADILAAQQSADDAQADIDAHIADTTDAHAGTAITNTPAGSLSATTVQAALNELQSENDSQGTAISTAQSAADDAQADATQALSDAADAQSDIDNHIADSADAHAASAITNTPAGSLAATTVQGALNELQSDVDGKQPLDATLTAVAGASTAADKLAYFSGVDTVSVTDFTSYARTLLDDVDATAARSTLGLVIGTNVQAWDADLDALAALSGTNTAYYRSGAGTWSPIVFGTNLTFSGGTLDATGGGGGSGEVTQKAIAQTAHGFAVGDVIRHNGTAYVKSQANSAANAEVIGIVTAVADANNFTVTTEGYASTFSGLTAGTTYFLSAATAGLLTATEPSTVGQVSKPVLNTVSTTAGYVFQSRGVLLASASTTTAKLAKVNGNSGATTSGNPIIFPNDSTGVGSDPDGIYDTSTGLGTAPAGASICGIDYYITGDANNRKVNCYQGSTDQGVRSDTDTNGPGWQNGSCKFKVTTGTTFSIRPNGTLTGNSANNAEFWCM